MEKPTAQKEGPKRGWVPTQGAFHRLLGWLDEESDSGGRRYLEMRRRLVLYFDRKNCRSPDELADETLNRVTRRLEEEGAIITDAPAHYCYIVARVLLESLREQQREAPLDDNALMAKPSAATSFIPARSTNLRSEAWGGRVTAMRCARCKRCTRSHRQQGATDCLRAIETTDLGNEESLPRLLDAAHRVGTDELHSALADAEPVPDRACLQPRFLSLILR